MKKLGEKVAGVLDVKAFSDVQLKLNCSERKSKNKHFLVTCKELRRCELLNKILILYNNKSGQDLHLLECSCGER